MHLFTWVRSHGLYMQVRAEATAAARRDVESQVKTVEKGREEIRALQERLAQAQQENTKQAHLLAVQAADNDQRAMKLAKQEARAQCPCFMSELCVFPLEGRSRLGSPYFCFSICKKPFFSCNIACPLPGWCAVLPVSDNAVPLSKAGACASYELLMPGSCIDSFSVAQLHSLSLVKQHQQFWRRAAYSYK